MSDPLISVPRGVDLCISDSPASTDVLNLLDLELPVETSL
jgi:hypothetical protein